MIYRGMLSERYEFFLHVYRLLSLRKQSAVVEVFFDLCFYNICNRETVFITMTEP
jgi:hypothetical protein